MVHRSNDAATLATTALSILAMQRGGGEEGGGGGAGGAGRGAHTEPYLCS